MFELVILFHVTLLGLSYWISRTLKIQHMGINGISYYLGIPFIALSLYFLNAGLSIGLTTSSRMVFGLAVLGLILLLKDKREIRLLLAHPVLYLLPLVGLFFAFIPEMHYQLTEWDEYGQWVGRPMNMILDDSILNPARHGYGRGGYDYTPGAALLLIYKDALVGKNLLLVGPLIVVPLVLFLSLLAAGYDVIKQLIPKKYSLPETICLAGVTVTLLTLLGGRFFPVNLLVESFQYNVIIAVGLCFYWVSSGGVSRRTGVVILGLLCAYAYLIKIATILLLPGLVAAFILQQIGIWRSARSEPIKTFLARLSVDTLILAGPAAYIIVHFNWLITQYEKTIALWTSNSLATWDARAYLMPKLLNGVSEIAFENVTITILMFVPLAGYLWGIIKKEQRYLVLYVLSFCALHLFLVVWLFRTMFDVWNAEHLASFSRYFATAQVPYIFFGLLLLGINLLAAIRGLLSRINHRSYIEKSYKALLISAGVMSGVIGMSVFGEQFTQRIQAIPFDPIPHKLDSLLSYIKANNLNSLKVFVIAQGSNTSEITKINFYSIRRDVSQHNVSFHGGRTLSTKQEGIWDDVGSRESIKDRLSKQDVIWIERSDEFTNGILSELTDQSSCDFPMSKYFLFKGAGGAFECKALQNPTQINCSSLWASGSKDSGIYEIDPDGFGPLPKIETRCNMEKPGGWTLAASISDKTRDHANADAVNKDDFFKEGKFGKLSDVEINNLALSQEYLLECGDGERVSEVFIRNHSWRSNESSPTYRGQYSVDSKSWIEFQERGAKGWSGFDNYGAAYGVGGNPKSYMAYSADEFGCGSYSTGASPGKGFLWVR